jgi:hypothetical protein
MLQIYPNTISSSDIEFIIQEINKLIDADQLNVKYYIEHKDTIKEVFNSDEPKLLQQERVDIKDFEVGIKIRNLLKPVIEFGAGTPIYLVKAHHPIGLHVDTEAHAKGKTIIIPLTFMNLVNVELDRYSSPVFDFCWNVYTELGKSAPIVELYDQHIALLNLNK